MKKILACMLLVALLASMLSVGAMAATDVTVSGTVEDATYSFYKVLDVEPTADGKGFLYKIDKNSAYFATVGTYFNLTQIGSTTEYYAAANTNFTAAAFAQAIAALANKGDATAVTADNTGSVIASLENGYYVITSTSGSNPMAISVPNASGIYSIGEKNGLPFINKYVDDTANVGTAHTEEACIGDTLYYKIVVTAEAGAQNYVVTDTLPAGLTLITDAGIKVVHGEADITNKVTITVDGQKITVDMSVYCAETAIAAKDELIITYSAVLNEKATISGGQAAPNTNPARLTYGSAGLYKDSSASVYTSYISFEKKDGNQNPLSGAKFLLSRTNGDKTEYAILNGSDPTYTLSNWTDDITKATTIVTAGNAITINGLGADSYTLIETEAPAGYIKGGNATLKVEAITSGGEISGMSPAATTVINTTGIDLPSTGGVGTTIFYILGAVLVLAAVVVLVTRKRMASDK